MNNDEYVKAAAAYATSIIIPSFVNRLIDELAPDGNCEGHVKMSVLWSVEDRGASVDLPDINGLMNGLAQITSFRFSSGGKYEMAPLTTRTFLPSTHDTIIHASENKVLIAARGYRHIASPHGSWRQHTYIRSFSLSTGGN